MIILTIRTDKPEAELGLYNDNNKLDYLVWQAHRQLAETLHQQIKVLLSKNHIDVSKIEAIVAFEGPGSFTGLRIGLSVANALAASLKLPIAGAGGEDWQEAGITKLLRGKNEELVMPRYGSDPHITTQKK